MKIKMRSGTVTINGNTYEGNVISIANGKIVVDEKIYGVEISAVAGFYIVVNGDVEKLESEGGDVKVNGTVGMVKTLSGDIHCSDVKGNVETMSGDIHCKKVGGNVKTLSGEVYRG